MNHNALQLSFVKESNKKYQCTFLLDILHNYPHTRLFPLHLSLWCNFMQRLNTPHYLPYFTLRFVDAKADTVQFAYICSHSLEEQ